MARTLVIGGTLFIGRALVRRLLARGDQVTILHRGAGNPFAGQTGEIRCDRNDTEAVKRALDGKTFDLVYDNVYDWQRGTTAGQVQALALALSPRPRRYVFTSSVAAYGEGLDLDEDSPLAPDDHPDDYVRNKAQTEAMLFALHREQGFPAVTLRPPYVYGPENPFYREAFFWDRLLAGRPVIVPGDGERPMQFILADDLARAAILAAESDCAAGRAYNIANPSPLTQRELVESLARAAGRKLEVVLVPREKLLDMGGRIFEPPYYFGQYFDMPPITQRTGRARQELGFEPVGFEEGLAGAFAWHGRRRGGAAPDFSFDDEVLASL